MDDGGREIETIRLSRLCVLIVCTRSSTYHAFNPAHPQVYAFAITLWELFTCGKAFSGTPYALLGHAIAREHKRPAFTLATPSAFRELVERCWSPDAAKRCEWKCGSACGIWV